MKKWKGLAACPVFCLSMALLCLLAVLQCLLPAQAHSALENRVLATLSMPTYASVLSGRWMRDAESVAADQLPARDSWMLLRGVWDTALCQTERNGILFGQDGRLFEACDTLDSTQALASVAALDALARQTGLDTTLMIVPLSSAVYPDALPAFYTAADSRALISSLLSSAQDLRTVDVLESLQALPSSTPAYYRTDHHWTADGALAAAQALARAWGLPAITPGTRQSHPGFYGSYYARAPSPFIAPDTLTFDDHPRLRLWIDGEEKFDLFDPVQLQSRDRYAALLWGNHGRLTCVSDAPDGTLLVVHDSYANAFLPYLTQIFQRVEAVDPRYDTEDIAILAKELEADKILCLYGLNTLLTDRSLALQSAYWPD